MTERTAQFRELYHELRITDQLRYYRDRRDEYGIAHHEAILTRNVLLVLSASAGLVGQVTNGTARAGWSVAAAVLAALAGAVTAYEGLIGFPQLQKLYNDVALNLAEAEIDWNAPPKGSDVNSDIERVEQIFRVENGQWGQLTVEGTPTQAPPPE
jgi:hypothetical protein